MPVSGPPDDDEFAELFRRHAGELRAHCYRMLGAPADAEDLVQDTFLRAWRARATFGSDGRREARGWLFRIATNACLDLLRSRARRVMPPDLSRPVDELPELERRDQIPWLQPASGRWLEAVAEGPEQTVLRRETIELAFVAALQHLPARQRAVLILRDVAGCSAAEAAAMLDLSVAAANSALQRARTTLRARLADGPGSWPRRPPDREAERDLVRRYVEAHERADVDAFAALVHEDLRLTMPPFDTWFQGRDPIVRAAAKGFEPTFGRLRGRTTSANVQPAVAWYLLAPGDAAYRAHALDVLHIGDGVIVEITSFVDPLMFEAFGLPSILDCSTAHR